MDIEIQGIKIYIIKKTTSKLPSVKTDLRL